MKRSVLVWALFLAAGGLLIGNLAAASDSQGDLRVESLESLTSALLGDSGGNSDEILAIAEQRHARLQQLVSRDPGLVLKMVVKPDVRRGLPPAVRGFVEEEVDLEGTLDVLVEDHEKEAQTLFFLEAGSERYQLFFAGQPPQMLTGQGVRIKGTRVDHAIAVESSTPHLETGGAATSGVEEATALPNTLGAQRTAVILVNFYNNTSQPYTVATARNVVFTTTSNWDLENSYGQTWLTGDVFGWFTIPVSSQVCDFSAIETNARAAATAAGANLNNYTHLVFAFPQNVCGWWGLGSVGGSPTRAWINGSLQLQVVAHEMGHNFGLYHAHSLDCHPQTLGATCTTSEYGDIFDTMGYASYHFNSFEKDRLGWLNYGASPPLTTVTATGTYNIDAMVPIGAASKALKVARGTTGSYFYLELRKSIGFDTGMPSYITNGVLVHLTSPTQPASNLLDMVPTTTSFMDSALPVGQSFTDSVSGVSFTVNSVGSSSASVTVGLGAPPPPDTCTHVPPAVSLVPVQAAGVPAGTPVPFTLTVTNRDVAPCTSSTFGLTSTIPSGWTRVFSTSSLTLAPGASGSATLTVTSATTAASGSYTITATARNNAATTVMGSASAVYVVNTPAGGGSGGDFSDNFDRANTGNLGAGWSVIRGGFAIVSNELRSVANNTDSLVLAAGLTGTVETVAADFASTDNSKNPQLGLVLRYQNPTNYYVLYRNIAGGGGKKVRISKIVNGSETVLANVSDANPAENTFFHLVARATGTTLTLEMDGVAVATATDATFATGQVGIRMAKSTVSNRADNFTATVQ